MANPEVQEVQRDKIEFNANNIKEDKDEILGILRNYQKGADYTFDGKKYFSFSRLNGNYIETVFVRDETLKALMEEDEEIEKAFTNIKSFKIETETKTNLTTLEAETNIKKFKSVTDVETYLKEQDEVVLRMIIEKYYNYYKSLKDNLPPSREGNRRTRSSLKKELKNGIRILNDFKDDLKGHKNKYGAITIQAYVAQLICYYPRYEEVSHLIAAGGSTSDIPRVILSKVDAKRARKQEKHDKKHQEEMNEILVETAIQSQENAALERQNEGLKHIINGEPIPPVVAQNMNRYTPTTRQEHTTTRQEHTTTRQSNYNTQNIYNSNMVCRPKTFNRKFGERFSNMLEQIFPKGMNKDPRQKEAWTNVGSIIAIGGAVFMGFKAIQSLKKNSEGKRNWGAAAGRTAGTLALMGSDRIIQTIQDAFNLHPAEKARVVRDLYTTYGFDDRIANDITKRYIYAPIETLSALHFIPLYELEANHILQEQDNQIIYNNDNFKQYINDRTDFSDEDKKELLKHGEKIKDDDLIGPGLGALGIGTMSELHEAYDGDKSKKLTDLSQTQKGLDHTMEQIESGVNAELFNQGLRAKPGAIDQIIKEYDAEKDNKKIKDLILDWMRRGLLEISDSSKEYNLQDMLVKDGKDLDLKEMTMLGGEIGAHDIKFNTYGELFDAINLTDFIKYHFAGRRSVDGKPPFHIDGPNGSIEFNNTEWYEIRKGETKVIKDRTLKNKYPTLYRSKDLYIEYLNKRRETTAEIDLSNYPLTNALGIKFYGKEGDEQEVNYLEKYLNDIKAEFGKMHSVYSTGYHTSNGTLPYKFNSLGNKLIFTDVDNKTINVEDHVNGSLSKIGSIRYNDENKEKLLNYLNNPSNGMFKD